MAAVHGTLNALGFALPVIVAWTLDRRARPAANSSTRTLPVRDLRRLGLGAAAFIAVYALVVGAISAGVGGLAGGGDFSPPETVPRPLLLVGLFMVPGALAVIGTLRSSGPILIAAGLLCLAQSFISFVALPFAAVGLVLFALGAEALAIKVSWRGVLGGIFVVVLGIAAWVAPFAVTETSCWVARAGADGAVVYDRTPVPGNATGGSGGVEGQIQLNLGDLASGATAASSRSKAQAWPPSSGSAPWLWLCLHRWRPRVTKAAERSSPSEAHRGHVRLPVNRPAMRLVTAFRLETLIGAPIERVFDLARPAHGRRVGPRGAARSPRLCGGSIDPWPARAPAPRDPERRPQARCGGRRLAIKRRVGRAPRGGRPGSRARSGPWAGRRPASSRSGRQRDATRTSMPKISAAIERP